MEWSFGSDNPTSVLLSSVFAVFPRSPKHNRMEQRYSGGPQGILLQQLDDPAIPAAPAAVHPAQLHSLPKVSNSSVWFIQIALKVYSKL